RHLDRLAVDGDLAKLGKIDGRHRPAAAVTADQSLGLEPQQCGPDRGARGAEAAFDPPLGQSLARADLQPEDHLAKLPFDILHLRHCRSAFRRRIDSGWVEVHDGYRFGIPKWYPEQPRKA